MRLSKYINEAFKEYKNEGRGKGISLEEAIKIAPQYSDAINSDTVITRHSRTADQHLYYLVDPKKSKTKRGSRNTFNYYTLVMDNSPTWSKYPKRSESLIASINKKCGEKFPLRLLPKNGSKIGVCDHDDLWFSFGDTFSVSMNRVTDALYALLLLGNDTMSRFDSDWRIFKKACKNFDKWYKEQKDVKEIFTREFGTRWQRENIDEVLKGYSGDLFKLFESKLNPDKNGFKLITTSNMSVASGPYKEVWTDSESLMVRCDEWWKFYKEI